MRIRLNTGSKDRLARFSAAIVLAAVPATDLLPPAGEAAVLVVALILIATAATGYCPTYSVLGLDTLAPHDRSSHPASR